MAGQGTQRRDVLRALAYASVAGQFAGFAQWCWGGQDGTPHSHPPAAQPRVERYTPQFLDAAEYAAMSRLADLILPRDQSPGALDAGVPEFIDFMLAHDRSAQYPFRTGLTWLNAHSFRQTGKHFTELSDDQQAALLRPLAYAKEARPGEEEGRSFFRLARRFTVLGYYTSKIGMEQLHFPGLRLYSDSPACPHVNDPEHRHLPPPIV